MSERLSLQGNPAVREDWCDACRTATPVDFLAFARTEGRFAPHFGPDGAADARDPRPRSEDRLANWRMLQELAGIS